MVSIIDETLFSNKPIIFQASERELPPRPQKNKNLFQKLVDEGKQRKLHLRPLVRQVQPFVYGEVIVID